MLRYPVVCLRYNISPFAYIAEGDRRMSTAPFAVALHDC